MRYFRKYKVNILNSKKAQHIHIPRHMYTHIIEVRSTVILALHLDLSENLVTRKNIDLIFNCIETHYPFYFMK